MINSNQIILNQSDFDFPIIKHSENLDEKEEMRIQIIHWKAHLRNFLDEVRESAFSDFRFNFL